ncbi:phosphatase PAP2 family protein [Companilactobacillus sp.]|uniref:phosphatase PAP2 family protein n=1 Tax=Companilactobacillus sp. TaxID=2767905 RepID=UPI0026306049|nr:phosphatase PAP2 family protein [Companilactobacillus sp.]
MKSSKFLTTANIILIIIFILWSWAVAAQTNFIHGFDKFFIAMIYQNHTATPLLIFRTLTEVGGTFWTVIITLVILIILSYFKYYYAAIFLAANKLVVVIINTIIKDLIRRPRPSHHHYMYEGSFNYPSGHSSSALSLYIPLLIICFFIFKKIGSRVLITTLGILLIIIIGYSRVYLGVHYPSDIVGGYLLAASVLTSTVILFRTKNIFVLDFKGIQKQSDN